MGNAAAYQRYRRPDCATEIDFSTENHSGREKIMSESLSWMQTGDTLALSGELDQDVLLPLWEMREEAVKGITCIDLSRVSRVDTGGLALLLQLIDLAKKQGNNVTLQGVNDKVYTLAKLYNLPADVLPR
ncbi:conserved hypothetical protein [Shigella boydii Sb227]|uniref:STAS domain-containing protein n=2 Tax=Shigella boydii TaxID=621 RepID=Q31W68_SHIBS|nr:conserved hypothetical protein [Shigella boydii Sb227]